MLATFFHAPIFASTSTLSSIRLSASHLLVLHKTIARECDVFRALKSSQILRLWPTAGLLGVHVRKTNFRSPLYRRVISALELESTGTNTIGCRSINARWNALFGEESRAVETASLLTGKMFALKALNPHHHHSLVLLLPAAPIFKRFTRYIHNITHWRLRLRKFTFSLDAPF